VKPRPHTHKKTWTEVSSSVPHFLQVELLLSPIIHKSFLKVLCPVRRPITTLDCVLLKENNRVLISRLGPEINSLACLCTTRNTPQQEMLVFYTAFILTSYVLPRDPKEKLWSIKLLNRNVSCELFGNFISSHSSTDVTQWAPEPVWTLWI